MHVLCNIKLQDIMNDKLGSTWKEASVACMEALFWDPSGDIDENGI
jgi:hypothetical protein